MKKIGISVGILLVLIIGSALVVPGFIDWNEYKSEIEQTASDLSDRKVVISGDLSLSILPSPSFSAQDVSVSNVEGGQATNFISLKSVDVNVAFFPLLRKQIQVKKFILVEPIVAIEVDENGRGNWEFGTEDENANTQSVAADLSFEQFQIENGQFSYQNLMTDQQELLNDVSAAVTMESLQGPFEIKGSAKYKNLPITTELMVGIIREGRKVPVSILAGLLNDDIKMNFTGGVLLDENSPQMDGKINLEAADIGDLFLAVSLLDVNNTDQTKSPYNLPLTLESNIAYGGDAINISGLEFEMGESRGSGKVTAMFDDTIRFDGNLAVNSFNLDNILPVFNDTNENQQSSNSESNEIDLSILNSLEGRFNFKLGALQFNEKIASQLDVDLNANAGQLEFTKVKLNMPGGSELSLDGALYEQENKPEFLGNVTLNSGNFRAFLEWLKIDVSTIPTGRLTRLAYQGGIKADPDLIQLYGMDGSLDTFQFKGGVSYALQARPSFGIDVSLSNLNIDNYLEPPTEEPIDFKLVTAILADFDANYKIKLANFTTQGITVKNIDAAGNLFNGNLKGNVLNIDDYAGFDIDGSITGSSFGNNPTFDLSLKSSAVSLLPLQRAYRFKTPYDIRQIGAIAVNGNIKGDFEKITVDITSTLGASKAAVKGNISSAALKQLPDFGSMDLSVNLSNPSLVNLIDQFDLPMEKALANDDKEIIVNAALKGNQQLLEVDGTIVVAGATISLKGNTKLSQEEITSFDMALGVNGPQVRDFIRGVGIDFYPAKSDLGPLQVKMDVTGTVDDILLKNISGNIGPTKLNGSGHILGYSTEPVEGQKPNVDFTLVLDNVPVQDFMEAETENNADVKWGEWNKEPMELEALNAFDGKAIITANAIKYNNYNFTNPRFEAFLKDGVINISNFTGKLFGGDVAIAGTFSSFGDLDMDMSLKNAAVVEATKSVAGVNPISGYFDLTNKITGKGTSQNELMSSLSGSGDVKTTAGIINGINIPELSKRLNGISNKNGILGIISSTLSGGQTPYEGGASTITTKNGFIQLSPLDVKMSGAKSAMNVGINLAQWNMNMTGDMALSDHPNAPPIGISVKGALHEPDIKYNTKQLEGFVAAKIATKLLQNIAEGNGGIGTLFGVPGATGPAAAPAATTPDGNPASVEQVIVEPAAPLEEAPAPVKQQESVEELGAKLLDRLFKKPPQ